MVSVIEDVLIEDILMVNSINDSANFKPIVDSQLKTKNKEAPKESVAEQTVSTDSVNFSDTSKQLEALKASFNTMPEVDSIRVSYFKSAVDSGNYQVDSSQIAKKMLNNAELV